jgi:4-amino-4-deoxy-L-arabinose transferase-like glycosyltransferase
MQTLRARPTRIADAAAPDTVDPYRAWKRAGLLLLTFAWIALGLAGHDPWKSEDATTFGVAWEMNQRSDYVVPRLAGEVYLPRPPLVPAIAAFTQDLLSPPLEPYNAARIAAGALLALTLLFSGLAAGELAGAPVRWLAALIVMGSVGLWDRATCSRRNWA